MSPRNMLDLLPNELLQHVISQCSKEDAMRGRLVDKALERACNPFVFSHLNLGSFSFSIHKLDMIASSPHKRHVRSIHVFTDQLRELSRPRFEGTLMGPIDLIPRETWPKIWHTYEAYRSDQINMLNDPSLQRTFREAVASLPFLQEVTMSHFSYPIMMDYPWPDHDPQVQTLEFARRLIYSTGWCNTGRDSQAVASWLDAIAHRSSSSSTISPSPSPLRKLTISTESFPDPFLIPSRLDPGASIRSEPHRLAAIREALKHLESFRLVSPPSRIILDGHALQRQDAERAAELVDLLAASSRGELTSLELVRPMVSCTRHHAGGWNRVFTTPLSGPLFGGEAGIAWPMLERLEYSGNFLSGHFLVFMGAHGGTLRELKLENAACEDWVAVLVGIRERLARLRRLELNDLFEWGKEVPEEGCDFFPFGMGAEAEEWLLGGGGEMPRWR